jgi:hypothetical protein
VRPCFFDVVSDSLSNKLNKLIRIPRNHCTAGWTPGGVADLIDQSRQELCTGMAYTTGQSGSRAIFPTG